MSGAVVAVGTARASRPRRLSWTTDLPIVALDTASILAAGAAAVWLRYLVGAPFAWGAYSKLAPLALLYPVSLALAGVYPAVALSPVAELRGVCQGTTLTFLFLAAVTFFERTGGDYSRAALLLAWLMTVITVPLARAVARSWLGRTGWWGARAILLGAGEAGRTIAAYLVRKPYLGVRIVAMLDDNPEPQPAGERPYPVLGGLESAPALAAELGATYAIPIVYVPLLMITHGVAFYLLAWSRREAGRTAIA